MDSLFDAYAQALPSRARVGRRDFPRADGEPTRARRARRQREGLDLLRGLLPAASLSHMGIYATGQAYEQLILHLLGHPLPEARSYGELILDAIKAVMPSFVARVERPERGGEWVALPRAPARGRQRWAARLGLDRAEAAEDRPVGAAAARRRRRGRPARGAAVRGRRVGEERTLRARSRASRPPSARSCSPTSSAIARTAATARAAASRRCATASRSSRDYGAFRDLQRHRMLTMPVAGRSRPTSAPGCPRRSSRPACGDALRPRARALRARSTSASPRRACATPRPTRSASATASATCWT